MSTDTATPPPKRSSRRRMPGEYWDDDFDFAVPSRHAGTATPRPKSAAVITEHRSPDALTTSSTQGRISPCDSWAGSWEDFPPGPSRLPVRQPKTPSPLNLPPLPRMSSSRSMGLPSSPTSRSSSGRVPTTSTSVAQKTSYPELGVAGPSDPSRERPVSTGTTKNKSVKRHQSSSYIPIMPCSGPSRTTQPFSLPSDSATRLPLPPLLPSSISRSKSTEQMPPPPVPTGRSSSKATKNRIESRSEVRISGIPFSPSEDQMRAVEITKRPGFWKRLSGSFSEMRDSPQDHHRRRRSSSVGGQRPPSLPQPPVPPLPPNIRSISAASSTSNGSASSSSRSGAASALSSIVRRSTSSLSRKSNKSRKAPAPSSYFHGAVERSTSSTSINVTPPMAAERVTRADMLSPPHPRTISQGFHLSSTSPGSPYRLQPLGAALPYSASYPGLLKIKSPSEDSDTNTETEGDGRTPRRKKIRPASALPPSRREEAFGGPSRREEAFNGPSRREEAFNGESWSGLPANRSESAQAGLSQTVLRPDLPIRRTSSGFSPSQSFQRLGSISKKHGRRMSGGLFASASPRSVQTLETVAGSPVKQPRGPVVAADEEELIEARHGVRAGSVSAPTSVIRPPVADPRFPSSLSAELIARKAAKERRRQSLNDFPIPKTVLEQQKGLKAEREAFKLYAIGVKSLRALEETRSIVRSRTLVSDSGEGWAVLAQLDEEFEQWWETAKVLIGLGSTGQSDSTQPSVSTSPRSRQVTLASDGTNSTAEGVTTVSPDSDLFTPRKSSLPDSAAIPRSGPPRASPPPEVWRASTGRQDPMTKRQREIFRAMLRTPVDGRPAMSSRQASTLSASSAPSGSVLQSAPMAIASSLERAPMPKSATQSLSISMPSPGDSAYIVTSGSFPSPTTAAEMLQLRKPSKAAPLAGLKAFLKGTRSRPSTPSHPERTSSTSRPVQSQNPVFPPTNPISPSSPTSDEAFSTAKSTASALGPAERRSRDPSPKRRPKRPNLVDMFRTSSGNWSDLVRGSSPAQQRERKSSAGSRQSKRSTDDPSSTSSAQASGVKTPITPAFDILKSRPWKSPKHPSKDRYAALTPTGGHIAATNHQAGGAGLEPTSLGRPADKADEDKTVRPFRKSRNLGLGWPVNPSPPPSPRPSAVPSLAAQGPPNSSNAVYSTGAMCDSPDRHSSAPAASSSGRAGGRVVPPATGSSSLPRETRIDKNGAGNEAVEEMDMGDLWLQMGTEGEGRMQMGASEEDEAVIGLTPENVPMLLDYLKECEEQLGEWRRRVEAMGLGK